VTSKVAAGRSRAALGALALALAAATVILPARFAGAQTVVRDYPVPGGWFFSQESRLPEDLPPFRGYTVVDDTEAAFWTEFRRFGGVELLGYPVSRRYRYPAPDGFLHQAFQRGILQWRPELGRAELANVFEQFTEQGLDDALEIAGIPRPLPPSSLPFEEEAQRRMTWITEPRFLARYFFDPVNEIPFEFQEAAWGYFGLPQSFPERPVYYREKANGKYGAPLYLPYIAQRFQKTGLQYFLENVPNDPTVVPGDGKEGCVAITAIGRLARRLGAGRIIPGTATLPEPSDTQEHAHFVAIVPPLTAEGQKTIQVEMIGTGFQPGEPVTIRLVPNNTGDATFLPTVVSRVDAVDPDGSFDQLVTARVGVYKVELKAEWSGMILDPAQDPTLNLTLATVDVGTTSRATYC
jgi:hypothetical protein